jgi:hypothetical protein
MKMSLNLQHSHKTIVLLTMKPTILFALLLVTTASAFVPSFTSKTATTTPVLLLHSSTEDDVHDVACVSTLDNRRTFLLTSATTIAGAAVCGTLVVASPSFANAASVVPPPLDTADYAAVAKDIAAIIKKDMNKGPTLVRLVSLDIIVTFSYFVTYLHLSFLNCC